LFTANPNAKVPWSAVYQDPAKFFDDEQLPASVKLREPSKLRLTEIHLLWKLWEGRQKKGIRALVFQDALPKDLRSQAVKGKNRIRRRAGYVEVSSLSDEEEKGVEGDGNGEDLGEDGEGGGEEEGGGREEGEDEEEGGGMGKDKKGEGEDEVGEGDDNGGADDVEVHPESPAFSSTDNRSKMTFIKALSTEEGYLAAIKAMKKVSIGNHFPRFFLIYNPGEHEGHSRNASLGLMVLWARVSAAILSYN
jgi:hypothetical protein